MLVALLMIAGIADWVPMRWTQPEPKSLEVLSGTPINCLLLEASAWKAPLIEAAAKASIAALGVIRPSADAESQAERAQVLKLNGVVLEGDFEDAVRSRLKSALGRLPVIELTSRAKLRLDSESPVIGTHQGVWPGIQAEENGATHAAPSGAPWINTNSGFLKFVRATTDRTLWIGHLPPTGRVLTGLHYRQAIGDAALAGARWIIALDEDYSKRLFSGEPKTLGEWKLIGEQLEFIEKNKQWRTLGPLGDLALVQDTDTGALFSGGILDMLAVKHTPVRPVPSRKLSTEALAGAKMVVNVSPSALNEAQKENLRNFTRKGGTMLSGPPSWQFPAATPERITLKEEEVKFLDDAWRDVNTMTGRRNLGARLFNVSSMLSNFQRSADGRLSVVLFLNYSSYPVENITVHMSGKFKSATIHSPGKPPVKAEMYDAEEGTGFDIPAIDVLAALVVE